MLLSELVLGLLIFMFMMNRIKVQAHLEAMLDRCLLEWDSHLLLWTEYFKRRVSMFDSFSKINLSFFLFEYIWAIITSNLKSLW